MKTIAFNTRMNVNKYGIKTFDIVQVTKLGTRTIAKATIANGLEFTQAIKFAESVRDRVNVYNAMKGV